MIDNTSKLDFMVEVLTEVTGKVGEGYGECRFSYFGLQRDAVCSEYVKYEGYAKAKEKADIIVKAMKQIADDKANYKKYLDAITEEYLVTVYDRIFRTMIVKFKMTYTSNTFPKYFPKHVKTLVLENNEFYVIGDCLDTKAYNALVAVDDLSQYAVTTPSDTAALLKNASDWSFEQLSPIAGPVRESADFTKL